MQPDVNTFLQIHKIKKIVKKIIFFSNNISFIFILKKPKMLNKKIGNSVNLFCTINRVKIKLLANSFLTQFLYF